MAHRRRQRQLEKRTYAETRARASLQLLAKGSLWQAVSTKQNVSLSKTTAEWKALTAARAVTKIHARLPHAIKMLFQAAESTPAFQAWARAVFPDTYLDAAIVEHLYDETDVPFEKRATTKWFATSSAKSKLLRGHDYYVVEWIGVESDAHGRFVACYLFQESLADMAEIGRDVGCDRAHIDALILKLERADDQSLLCSLAFQMVTSSTSSLPFTRPAAVDMAYRLAKGIRDALEGHGLQPNPPSSPVVRSNQCFECAKTFHLFKRRVQCRYCHHRLCAGCQSRHMCPSATLDSIHDDDEEEAEAELIAWMRLMSADDNRLDAASTIVSDTIDHHLVHDVDSSSSLQLSSIASPMSYATMSESAIDGLLTLDDSQSGQSFVNAPSFGPSFNPSVFESNMAMKDADLLILEHPNATFEGPSLVAVGSAWALEIDVEDAVVMALADLRASIGHAHFLVVSYSSTWSPEDIQMLLATHAPDVPYIGGTIARGICDDEAWIAKHKHSNEGLVAIWGVHDPLGTYVVGHTEYDQLSARREVHCAMAASYMSTGATPDFCMLFASPLFIEDALEGARSGARHCPLVGGCATNANSKTWSQISSARGFTQLGLSYCLAAPSVKTVVSWFSGYGSLAAHGCVGPATDVAHKTVQEISGRPAADVYYEWLAMAAEKNKTDLAKTRLPKLGNIHPIGVLIPTSPATNDLVVRNTPVVLDLSVHSSAMTVSSPIEVGATIALMELSTETVLAAIESWGNEITSQHLLPTSQVSGCLLFMSASVQALLGATAMAEMVGACQRWTENAPFLALSTYGQIGQATDHGHSTPLYDPLMFASVVFTSESKRASDA